MTLASTAPTALDGSMAGGVWRIAIVHSSDSGQRGMSRVLTESQPLSIGRGTSTDTHLALDDAEVSRVHVVIERQSPDRPWTLRDNASRNGTFVEGRRVEHTDLANADLIRVGSHLLQVQYLSALDCEVLVAAPLDRRTLLGDSLEMMRVRLDVRTVGRSARAVLILGETGVGKELVAAELHRASGRTGPFVAVNCAALPENLIESELFGHAKGAFTGATNKSEGLFGRADRGTIFLDEIGDMPAPLQSKLLRVLATGELRGVGETEARTIDVRVIAATNVDLDAAIAGGGFRADLYSRLMGATIRVPPLRERRDDVLLLAEHFLRVAGREVPLDADAAEALLLHPWRFNVRELEQVVHRAALALDGATALRLEHLPPEIAAPVASRRARGSTPSPSAAVPLALRVRRDAVPSAGDLREVLRHFAGNVAQVADYFGKDRRQIYRWAETLEVELESYRS